MPEWLTYWSPQYPIKDFPLPVLPMTTVLPLPLAGWLFRVARPLAFSLHCRPLNRVRKENGLPSLGSDSGGFDGVVERANARIRNVQLRTGGQR